MQKFLIFFYYNILIPGFQSLDSLTEGAEYFCLHLMQKRVYVWLYIYI